MKLKLISKGKESSIEAPENFSGKIRPDILLKVFESQKYKQPMGVKIGAGAGYSASGILRHKRHAWKVTYGKGISRVPRKIFSRHGASFQWQGATAPNTRGGRRAHPPKAEENQFRKINKKELLIAFNSGFAGTCDKKSLEKKYGINSDAVIFDSFVLNLKTKEFFEILKKAFENVKDKILQKKSVRAGKGKLRGRRYKKNAGLLFVIASDEEMKRKGIDVVKANELEISDLAPNGEAGRFTAYTEKAIKEIEKEFK